MNQYCSKCGAELALRKKGKVIYSTDLPGHIPFYSINIYSCPNAHWPFLLSSHDQIECPEETEEYRQIKLEYDKKHHFPLPDATMTRRHF